MYKYNSNFGAGCPNWAVWADLRFGFVHSTDILQKNYDVFCDQETQLLHWWIARKKMFLPCHLMLGYLWIMNNTTSIKKRAWLHIIISFFIYYTYFLTSSNNLYTTFKKEVGKYVVTFFNMVKNFLHTQSRIWIVNWFKYIRVVCT